MSNKLVPANAPSSVRVNLDPDSNVIKESDLDLGKHPALKTSSDAGITIAIDPVS
jgi:hypothetical protein